MYTLAWSCTNSLIILYFFVAALCMAFLPGFNEEPEAGADSRANGEDDDRNQSRRRKYDDDDDDDRPRPKKRKNRDDD